MFLDQNDKCQQQGPFPSLLSHSDFCMWYSHLCVTVHQNPCLRKPLSSAGFANQQTVASVACHAVLYRATVLAGEAGTQRDRTFTQHSLVACKPASRICSQIVQGICTRQQAVLAGQAGTHLERVLTSPCKRPSLEVLAISCS